jgi:hypothetical protein|tara:strand:+ start:251 stop:364 length:114 start_codon:yes stop_codon:yes gene_type:complete
MSMSLDGWKLKIEALSGPTLVKAGVSLNFCRIRGVKE